MQEGTVCAEQYVCVFLTSDSSLWTKKLSELKDTGNADIHVGSKVTFKLPLQFLTQQGEQVIMGEQEYKGTVLFHAPGLKTCEEKQHEFQGFISEKKDMPGPEMLDLLLKEEAKEFTPLEPYAGCNIPSPQTSKTAEGDLGPSCKKIKTCDFGSVDVRNSSDPIAPPHLHSTWSLPPVSVKSEQVNESRMDSSLDDNSFQFSLGDLECVEETEDEEKEEENSDKNNPFAVLEKLIKENQSLKKENARLKQMLLAAQHAAPFRLFSQETRDSAAYYLRLVLDNLEKTNSTEPSPSTSEAMRRLSVPKATNVQVPLVLHPKDPERYSHVLVDSFKVRDSISKARAAKDHGITLLNQAIDMVFSTAELAQSSGLGMRGNRKDDALDPLRVQACREFVRSICKENNWEEPTEAGLRKRFSNKITNARRELKLKTQLSPDENVNE